MVYLCDVLNALKVFRHYFVKIEHYKKNCKRFTCILSAHREE